MFFKHSNFNNLSTIRPIDANTGEKDMSMDSSSGLTSTGSIPHISSKSDDLIMSCSSSANGLNTRNVQPLGAFSTTAIAGSSPHSIADNLSISSMDYFSTAGSTLNGVNRKNSPNRDGSFYL